jgi:hypothetical protein
MTLTRLSKIFFYLLMAVTLVFTGLLFFGGNVPGTAGTSLKEPLVTDEVILWAYILVALTGFAAVIFPILYTIANPKNAVRTLGVLAAAAILIGLAYSQASGELIDLVNYTGKDNNPTTLKLSDTGLFVTYMLAALAFLSILYTEIAKLFK